MDELYADMIRRLKRILRIVVAGVIIQDIVILLLLYLHYIS